MAYEQRLHHLQQLLKQFELDVLVIHDGTNMAYLTGFSGGTGDGVLLVRQQTATLITDGRYEAAYTGNLPERVGLAITRQYWAEAVRLITAWSAKQVGFEAHLPYDRYTILAEDLPQKMGLHAVPDPVAALREVKDSTEQAALQKAADVSVAAFKALLPFIKPGVTERQVANELDRLAKALGAEKSSFDTIVASGARGALPHGEASDKVITTGELVTIDFGYYVDGYTSDITRTVAVGPVSPEWQARYASVLAAQRAAVAAVAPGVPLAAVDRAAREPLTAAGYGDAFNHATGHGAGRAIHEGPVVAARATDDLVAGNLVTIEPGIYFAGQGGIRIEDDILVTATGSCNLTAGLTCDLVVLAK